MAARGYADVALTSTTSRGAVLVNIAIGRHIDSMRARAMKAFEEFFLGRARDVYPRYDFTRMNEEEYGAFLTLN